ncbi:MAG TPA: CHAT domain-containing protein [Chloroflexaceae bacterium]|nr:CHAT domain-containing protein [Chloroflexaceae bacterium]
MNVAQLELTLRELPGGHGADLRFTAADGVADSDLVVGAPVSLDRTELIGRSLDPVGYGQALTRMLFADERLRVAWGQARGYLEGAQVPARLRLRVEPGAAELHSLRWELLQDPLRRDPTSLATSERIILSRYLPGDGLALARRGAPQGLSALLVAANPANLGDFGLGPVDAAGEVARAAAALGAIRTTALASAPGAPVTLAALASALQSGPEILYIVAHGTLADGLPYLWLEDAGGRAAPTAAGKLVQALGDLARRPLIVVLAACESAGDGHSGGAAATALGPRIAATGVPAVVAMQGLVSADTVAAMMTVFFAEVRRSGLVDLALARARAAVLERPDWWAPALFLRLRDGALWEPGPAGSQADEGAPARDPAAPVDRRALRELLVATFDIVELEELCSDVQQDLEDSGVRLQVNLEMVGGTRKPAMVLNLIDYLNRRGYLAYLVKAVRRRRPGAI